jgi:Phage integrase family
MVNSKNAGLRDPGAPHGRRGRGRDRGGQGAAGMAIARDDPARFPGCGRPRSATFVGTGSTSTARCFTSAGSRTAPRAPTRSRAMGTPRRLQREILSSPFVFVSERGSPFTTAGFARILERAAASAGLEPKAQSHMQRHACGCALANNGQYTQAIRGGSGIGRLRAQPSTPRWRRDGSRTSGGSED